MPRNSSGVYSKPAGTTAVAGNTIDPVAWNTLTSDLGNEITNSLPRDGSAPMTAPLKNADGTQAQPSVTFASDITTGIYKKAAGVLAIVAGGVEIATFSSTGITGHAAYAEKSANYTAAVADAGYTLRFTSAATLTLTAAATLGLGWSLTIFAYGGDVTITPNGTDPINGFAASIIVKIGRSVTLYCDGTGFYESGPGIWEVIGDYSFSAVAQLAVTNLAPFRKLRLSGYVEPSTNLTALGVQVSIDNGVTYITSGTQYGYSAVTGNGSTVAAASGNNGFAIITGAVDNTVNLGCDFTMEIENFNKAQRTLFLHRSGYHSSSILNINTVVNECGTITAKNALRLIPAAGTITGTATLEGVRG